MVVAEKKFSYILPYAAKRAVKIVFAKKDKADKQFIKARKKAYEENNK
jgi:hypothetical protein